MFAMSFTNIRIFFKRTQFLQDIVVLEYDIYSSTHAMHHP